MQPIEHLSNVNASTIGTKLLGLEPVFHSNVTIQRSQFGAWTEVGANSYIIETTFDDYSYTAGDNQIIYSEIGKFSNIASHVRINPGNHPVERVTMHHMMYRRKMYGFGEDDAEFFQWRRDHKCVVGHDTWLGHNVIVLPGVTMGHGSVAGSGSVVTHDVDPYTIVVGVPARPLRTRFPQTIINTLLKIEWWHWDHDTLKARLDDLNDVEKFLETYG